VTVKRGDSAYSGTPGIAVVGPVAQSYRLKSSKGLKWLKDAAPSVPSGWSLKFVATPFAEYDGSPVKHAQITLSESLRSVV